MLENDILDASQEANHRLVIGEFPNRVEDAFNGFMLFCVLLVQRLKSEELWKAKGQDSKQVVEVSL